MLGCRHIQKLKTPRLKDFTAFFFIFRLLFRNLRLIYYHFQKSKVFFTFFHPEETKSFFKHKYNTAGRTIREMLYRFPISIYIIFSRLRHPQTLAALVHLRSFGKKNSPVCPHEHSESHTNSKGNRKKKQNPQTFVFRLDTAINVPHKPHEYLEAISFFS